MLKRSKVLAIVGALLFVVGCAANASPRPSSPVVVVAPPAEQPKSGGQPISDVASSDTTSVNYNPSSPAAAQDRIVLKNAIISIVVGNPAESLATINKMATDMGGWVVSSTTSQTKSGVSAAQASIVIRVPADRLNEALDRIKAGVVSVESENVTGQDVTQQYTDLTSQLANLEAAEAQLRKLMDAAGKTDDVLVVYRELVKVRGDIERIKGQLQYYKESAAYSSITVTLLPNKADKPIEIAGWRPGETLKGAFEALVNTLQGIVNVVIWLVVYLLPLMVMIGLPIWLILRFIQRRRPANPPAAPESPAV